jgi:hypothetical protein
MLLQGALSKPKILGVGTKMYSTGFMPILLLGILRSLVVIVIITVHTCVFVG